MPLNRARTGTPARRGARGSIPAVLLTDTVTVQPYRDVDTWGLPYPLRCLIDESPGAAPTDSGTVAQRTIRIFAQLGSDVPEGSKLTLPDGRNGSAQACAQRAPTAAFPVPSHLEIVMTLGTSAPTPIGGRTVTIIRRDLSAKPDEYGNDVYRERRENVRGVAVGQIESSDSTDPDNTRVTRSRVVVFPPKTVLQHTDRLYIDGKRWAIDGEPTVVEQPVLGLTAGVVVRAVQTTG
jgi:hypothetical protein